MKRIAITSECVCDLPDEVLKEYGIDIIYFDIKTEGGMFRDTKEIHTRDVLEYMAGGVQKAMSFEPTPRDYRKFFEQKLIEYDEIIHITISSKIAVSYDNSMLARSQMGIKGQNVYIVDSAHLSAGQGMMAIRAARLANEGKSVREILDVLEEMKSKISTSFITKNAEYLYYNGRASETVMKICRAFALHPVLYMKDGLLVLKGIRIGRYDKAGARYIKSQLKHSDKIYKNAGFIIHAGCSVDMLKYIYSNVEKYIKFDKVIENVSSATVSCNCGPDAFGIIYMNED